MNKTIYYPPRRPIITHVCLDYALDTLTIEFDDPGRHYDNNENAFTEELPIGYLGPHYVCGPYAPKHQNSSVKLTFRDSKDKNTYEYDITIKSPC